MLIGTGAYAAINLTAQKPAEHSALKPGINIANGEKGLVGWWKLNGNTKDSTPYGNNGTNHGAIPTTDRKGTANGAMAFDGSSVIDMGNPPALRLTGNLTMTAWIKTSYLGLQGVVSKFYNTSSNRSYRLGLDAQGRPVVWLSPDGDTYFQCQTGTSEADGQWHFLAAAYNAGAQTLSIYGDGTLLKTCTGAPSSLYDTSRPFEIGSWDSNANSQFYFQGSISDVRLYNHALSQSDITNLYNSYNSQINLYSPPGSGNGVNLTAGLVGYWPFNGNARDATPFSHNGTLLGNPLPTLTAGHTGAPDSAYSLNGSTNRITTSAAGLPANAITVAAWVYMPSTVAPAGGDRFVNNNWLTVNGSWLLFEYDTGSGPYASFGVGDSGLIQHDAVCNAGTFTTGVWHFLVGTYDGTAAKVYQDGLLCRTNNLSGQTLNTAGNFEVASFTGPGVPEKVDDVRIYSRALSAAEVAALYNLPD